MATRTATGIYNTGKDGKKAIGYYEANHLSRMAYQVELKLGGNDLTKVRAPIWGEIKGNKEKFKRQSNIIYTRVSLTNSPELSSILNRDFLNSLTEKGTHLPLFDGYKSAVPFIRFIENDTPTLFLNQHLPESHIQYTNKSSQLRFSKESGHELDIEKFDWKTPVEFLVAFSSAKLGTNAYDELGLNWRSLSCNVELNFSDIIFDNIGPKYSTTGYYIGKVTLENNEAFLTIDKDVPKEHIDYLKGLIKAVTPNKYQFSSISIASTLMGRMPSVLNDSHLFLANFKLGYASPKGHWIESLRPFGEKPWLEGFSDIKINLRNFCTQGQSGFINYDVKGYGKAPCEFSFNQPSSYTHNQEWTKANPELAKEYSYDKEKFEFFNKNSLTEEEVKKWIEKQATAIEFSDIAPKKAFD